MKEECYRLQPNPHISSQLLCRNSITVYLQGLELIGLTRRGVVVFGPQLLELLRVHCIECL